MQGPGRARPPAVASHPIPPVEDPRVTEPRPEPITELPDKPPAQEPPETPPAPKRLEERNAMSRALWKGAISFGLIHVPVEIYSAEKRHELDFDMLDKRDLQPVGYQRINKKTGKVVPWEQIVKGYEHTKGKYVVLSEADFREANVEKTQTIDILSFVDIADIPVIHFDTPHYLVPARGGAKGYALLLQTLEKAKKAAVAQVVIRTRQRLAAVMPSEGMLVLCTLRYGYEIRPRDELEAPAEKKAAVSGREVAMALQLGEGNERALSRRRSTRTPTAKTSWRASARRSSPGAPKPSSSRRRKQAAPRKSAEVIDLVSLLKQSLHKTKQPERASRRA
jgi:DNA end-binding protein Ku